MFFPLFFLKFPPVAAKDKSFILLLNQTHVALTLHFILAPVSSTGHLDMAMDIRTLQLSGNEGKFLKIVGSAIHTCVRHNPMSYMDPKSKQYRMEIMQARTRLQIELNSTKIRSWPI